MTLRDRYEAAVRGLVERVAALRRAGLPPEAIAREVHAERQRLAIHYKGLTPEPYRSRIAARTIRVYGNPHGPSIDFLRQQGKTWEAIIAGATRPGPPVGLEPEDGRRSGSGAAESRFALREPTRCEGGRFPLAARAGLSGDRKWRWQSPLPAGGERAASPFGRCSKPAGRG